MENQEKIAELIEEKIKKEKEGKPKEERRKWNKYYGDMCVRIFREFIMGEIPNTYTLSSPNAYICGCPTEFDLLIINKDAKPIKYTNAYRIEDVRVGIEIKSRGVFGGRSDVNDVKKTIEKIKDNFDAVRDIYPNSRIDFVYLTYEEVASVKRKNSINYLQETINILSPYPVFCLKDSRADKLINGEWKRFIVHLNKLLE